MAALRCRLVWLSIAELTSSLRQFQPFTIASNSSMDNCVQNVISKISVGTFLYGKKSKITGPGNEVAAGGHGQYRACRLTNLLLGSAVPSLPWPTALSLLRRRHSRKLVPHQDYALQPGESEGGPSAGYCE